MHIHVCLLAFMVYIHVCLSRSRLCHALYPLWTCAYWSLRPLAYVVASVSIFEIHLHGVGVLDSHLSPLCAMLICLPCLLCDTHLASFASLHLYMLAYMFFAWVCVSSILQSNVIMDIRSKPTFILVKHPLLFDNMFVCLFVCFTCLFAPIWHLLIACLLACFPFTCFSACLLACFFCHCMYTHGAWTLGARVKPPRRKQNGQGCKQGDASPQRAMFSRLGGLAPPEWFSLSLPL